MKCLICCRPANNDRFKLCFNCWRDLGQPKDESKLQEIIAKNPGLVSALIKTWRI